MKSDFHFASFYWMQAFGMEQRILYFTVEQILPKKNLGTLNTLITYSCRCGVVLANIEVTIIHVLVP